MTVPARVIFFVYEVVAISAVVQLGLALPMVVYFHRVGISGLSANAIVVPLMGVVVPVGFVAIFTGWHWVARIAGLLLSLSHRAVSWHAGIEPNWRIPSPPVWLGIALAAALIAAAFARRPLAAHSRRRSPPPLRWRSPDSPVPRRRSIRRAGDHDHRRRAGRQHPRRLPRWQAPAGRWRRHPRLSAGSRARASISART